MAHTQEFRTPRAQHLRLGLFSANCQGGLAISTAPGGWRATWDNNLALAELADARGFDFHLPVARWIGSGHPSGWMDESLDPIAWAISKLGSSMPPGESISKMMRFMPELFARRISRSTKPCKIGSITSSILMRTTRGVSPEVAFSRRNSRGKL